jgi:hypothetical protein
VAAKVANDSDLPTLTRAEVNLGRFAVDTSSYAVWSENNHTNTNITLETNE